MRIRTLLTGVTFATAIGMASLFSPVAATPALAAGNGNVWTEMPVPSYLYYFDDPLQPEMPAQPLLGN